MPARCAKCKAKISAPNSLFEFLWEDETRSPKLCCDCYEFLVDKYEEGMKDQDIQDLIDADDVDE